MSTERDVLRAEGMSAEEARHAAARQLESLVLSLALAAVKGDERLYKCWGRGADDFLPGLLANHEMTWSNSGAHETCKPEKPSRLLN
jgi:hypothetical protein